MTTEKLEIKAGAIFPDEATLRQRLEDNYFVGTRVVVYRLPEGRLKVHDFVISSFQAQLMLTSAQAVAEQLQDNSDPYIIS